MWGALIKTLKQRLKEDKGYGLITYGERCLGGYLRMNLNGNGGENKGTQAISIQKKSVFLCGQQPPQRDGSQTAKCFGPL
jgi:hypothetical protein